MALEKNDAQTEENSISVSTVFFLSKALAVELSIALNLSAESQSNLA